MKLMKKLTCHAHLTGEGFEESSGTDNGVGDVPRSLQGSLKLELCMLELQEGLLDTDGAEKHEMR